MSKAKDIQTSEISRSVKTSPSTDQLDIDMAMVDGGVDVFVNGLEKEAQGYQFKVAKSAGRLLVIKLPLSLSMQKS